MITLLTDFGTRDYFVAALKGSILSINPKAQLVDITHEIAAHDIMEAAFTLNACYRDFPQSTIHLAVVDPGVGSSRRPIVAISDGHFFVGPDNGIFNFVFSRSRDLHVVHATNPKFHRAQISSTFHGRDVFAPLAAHLDLGINAREMGSETRDFQKLEIARLSSAEGEVLGEIIHIDRFGNCITNLRSDEIDIPQARGGDLEIGTARVAHFADHFAEVPEGVLFAYFGSAGYIEMALRCESAASRFGVKLGTPVRLKKREGKEA